MPARFVDVIVDVPALLDREFTYELPAGLSLPAGAKVRVPFGRGEVDGFVAGERSDAPGMAVKPVKAVYSLEFMPGPDLLRLAGLVSERYCAPRSSGLSCLWPPVVPKLKPSQVLPTNPSRAATDAAPRAGATHTLVRGDRRFRWTRYVQRLRESRAQGRGAIVIVPEIKGVEEILRDLESAFPGEVAPVHSELTGVARRAAYLSLARREKPIALGTRSAVFAPVPDLGLIILDEESSESHRAPETPFYDSREVALMRSGVERCDVLFGSDHPSVECVWRVRSGAMREERQDTSPRSPSMLTVDLREAKRGRAIMSAPLTEALAGAFRVGGRAVLFLNRRGEFTQVTCRDCGETLACDRCSVPLTYHAKEKQLVCHTCGRKREAPEACPNCGGRNWRFGGFGIERAESEFRRLFPEIPFFRMDKESSRTEAPDAVMAGFRSAAPACLLSTAMVFGARGLPPVALVGVLSSDTVLNLPDYRASEKVFHLLSSLRGLIDASVPQCTFIVQTYNPDNAGVRGVLDPDSFYDAELEARRVLGYPPFRRLFKVHFQGRKDGRAREAAFAYVDAARREYPDLDVLGPSPAPKARVRGEYIWQVAVRGGDPGEISRLQRQVTPAFGRSVRVTVEPDPA